MQNIHLDGRYDDLKDVSIHVSPAPLNAEYNQTHFVTIKRFHISKPKNIEYPGHEFLELIFCQKGGAKYQFDDKSFLIQKGDILVIHPNIKHLFVFPISDHTSFEGIIICISPDTANVATGFAYLVSGGIEHSLYRVIHTAGTKWEHLLSDCEEICHDAEQRQIGWQGVLFGSVFAMLGLISRVIYEDLSTDRKQQILLESILEYIKNNLQNKITVSDTAKLFYISESYLCKLFRKKMNTSFYKYVIQCRLTLAKKLIAENIPLEQISIQTGFYDHAALYRAFKQEYGISLQQYRKQIANRILSEN